MSAGNKPLKVAYVTTYDARDVHQWSGSGTFITRALGRSSVELEFVGPLAIGAVTWLILKSRGLWYNRLLGRRYMRSHDLLIAREFARQVDRMLSQRPGIDVIFSPGTVPVAFVEDQRPLAIWSDATHGRIFDYYPEYSGMCARNRRDGHRIEQAALDRAAAAMFTSEWAAESALDEYGMPEGRVHVVPFGANVEDPPGEGEVEASISSRPTGRCRLLFIGVDWSRKGGPLAVDVAERLNASGLPTELTVAGCNPFGHASPPPFVKVVGFLSKGSPESNQRLRALLSGHHFLIVPSIAECYGLVYCEANCFGMPCLARRTGGVPTIIRDGQNGRLFDPAADADAYTEAVLDAFRDYTRYLNMAREARRHYRERLNWDVAGQHAARVLRGCIAKNPLQP